MVSVPLRGVDCFEKLAEAAKIDSVSVPLRGVDCFFKVRGNHAPGQGFRPLAGCRLFQKAFSFFYRSKAVSVPLRGVDCFGKHS